MTRHPPIIEPGEPDQLNQVAQRRQVEESMDRTAERAVEAVLTRLGIDSRNPLQAQADFQKLRAIRKLMDDEEFQLDIAFIRRWRTATEKVADTGVRTAVKVIVLFVLGLLSLGTKDWWIKHITG